MTAGVGNPSGAGGIVALAEPEAAALFARGGFSTARRERINRYIRMWKQAGCWEHVAGLWFFAAESRAQALLNWAASGADATLSGSPEATFTADKGFSDLAPTKQVRAPWVPSALGGTDFGLAFAGLINATITQSSDGLEDEHIVCAANPDGGSIRFAYLLRMNTGPVNMQGIQTSGNNERLSIVSRSTYSIVGATKYKLSTAGAAAFSTGVLRNSGATNRVGILKRWAGLAVLKATISEAQSLAFAQIWDSLVTETGALD